MSRVETTCPKCGHLQSTPDTECEACGMVFAAAVSVDFDFFENNQNR